MAELGEKLKLNAPGKYYVDSSCINCGLCRNIAPDLFTEDDTSCMSYVHRQPTTEEEEALAQEALDNCPTDSIGADG